MTPMTTDRLYYLDSVTLDFDARLIEIAEHRGKSAIVLDRSYFYPESGGQSGDHGVLTIDGAPYTVIDTQSRSTDRTVLHIVDRPVAPVSAGTPVHGSIDRDRRLDLTRHHSAQHILSAALEQAADARTVSVHMGDNMTIDVDRPSITQEQADRAEALANRIILDNLPVRVWFPEPDELAALDLRKMPDVVGKVRIVDIGGFDITACGGTHVRHSAEIGMVKFTRIERRNDLARLEFKAGTRALADYTLKNTIVNNLSNTFTVSIPDVADSIARLSAEAKALRAENRSMREQLADLESASLINQAESINGIHVAARVFTDRTTDEVRLLAQKFVAQPDRAALFGVAGEKAQLIFARSESGAAAGQIDCVSLLKTALSQLSVERGGGRPHFAQGGGVTASPDQLDQAIRAALDSIRTT